MGTDFARLDALAPLPADGLWRQWRLAEGKLDRLSAWPAARLGSWWLQHHEGASVTPLLSSGGETIGWLVGAALLPPGTGERGLVIDTDAVPPARAVARALYGENARGERGGPAPAGLWAAILIWPGMQDREPEIRLAASHSVLYAPAQRCVATSHSLFEEAVRDNGLAAAVDPLATRSHYAFGLTGFSGLARLQPGHALDLARFEAARHWPPGPLSRLEEDEAAARVMTSSAPLFEAAAAAYPVLRFSLSAGRDSRAVLALARGVIDKGGTDCRTFTTVGRDPASRLDGAVAAQLAAASGLPHEIKTKAEGVEAPAREGIERAFVRIGEAMAGQALAGAARAEARGGGGSGGALHLAGMGGEVARGFYWQGRWPRSEDVTPAALARVLRLPASSQVLGAVEAWLAGLPEGMADEPGDVLDLLYVEARLGAWNAPSQYLFPGTGRRGLSLMTEAGFIDAALRLPIERRREGRFQEVLVEAAWPALSALPYNRAEGLQRLGLAWQEAAKRLSRAAKRARAAAGRASRRL